MQATVISVQPNVTKQGTKGAYQVHIFTYQGDPSPNYPPKPPTARHVFAEDRGNPTLAGKVLALQPGQRVQLEFVPGRNPQYPNLSDVILLDQGAPAQPGGFQQPQPGQQQLNPQPGQYQPPAAPQVPAAPAKPAYKARDYAEERRHRDGRDDIKQASIQRQCCLKAAVRVVNTLLDRDGYYAKKYAKELIRDQVVFFADEFEKYLLKLDEPFDPEQGVNPEFPEPPIYNDDDEIPF